MQPGCGAAYPDALVVILQSCGCGGRAPLRGMPFTGPEHMFAAREPERLHLAWLIRAEARGRQRGRDAHWQVTVKGGDDSDEAEWADGVARRVVQSQRM